MRAIRVAGLAIAAILPIAAMACGGGSSNSATATSSSSNSGNAGSAAATTKPTSSSNPLAELQNAGSSFKNGNFKITYQLTETDKAGKTTTGTMAIAIKAGKSSFTIAGGLSGGQGSFTVIDDGTNSFICTVQPQKQCLKSKSTSTGTAATFLTAFQPDNIIKQITASGGTVKQVGDQTIAGRGAKCFEGQDSSSQGTVCIDKKDNVLLSAEGTTSDGSKSKFVATQVGGSPSDSDFTPPYPVQSIPGQ